MQLSREKFHRMWSCAWRLVLVAPLAAALVISEAAGADEAAATTALAAGLTPQEAAAHMRVPEGFHVDLVAGEPDVHQPVAMAIDSRGRLWIAEAYTYPIRAPEGEGRDRIVILEDADHDGRFESRKVFLEKLNLVSGLEVGFGGVWIGAAPYLMFVPDRDHDDQPDGPPQILLDGFGYHDTHETLNAFIWGPDGWLYGCHGVFTHSRVGKPGAPDQERVPLNAGIWRYHPVRHEFEVFAWGTSNPWGVDFNDLGQAFATACVIPHLYHVIQGARYQRQAGSHFESWVFDDIKTIADHKHYAGAIQDHAWWGHEPELPADTSAAGGGHAHCGAMIYLGDNWPSEYRNCLLMHNIHGNRINQDILVRRGSGYVGQHGPDFLLANDKWFRGIALKYGPDGAVYLIDWYDPNACHRTNPEIWDRTNGRVYRVRYGQQPTLSPNLRAKSDLQLVQLQQHTNDWYVRMARRLLQERAANGTLDPQTGPALLELLRASQQPTDRRLRALWALHATGQLDGPTLLWTLRQPDPYLQAWAVQLACEQRQPGPEILEAMASLAEQSASPVVRLYLASALQRLPLDDRWEIGKRLVGRAEDAQDHNLPLMIWYGLAPLAETDPARLLAITAESQLPALHDFAIRWSATTAAGREAVVAQLDLEDPAACTHTLRLTRQALEAVGAVSPPPSWNEAYERLVRHDDRQLREQAELMALAFGDRRILPRLRQILTDAAQPAARRHEALQAIVQFRDPDAADSLLAVMGEQEFQAEAVRGLALYDAPTVADRLIAGYESLGPEVRPEAIQALASRKEWAGKLMLALGEGTIPRRDIHAYHIRQIMGFHDPELEELVRQSWGQVGTATEEKQAAIEQWKLRLAGLQRRRQPDPTYGRRLFAEHCGKCHQLFGEGSKIGPDLTGSNRAELDYILENILAPSAVVGKDYQLTVITTSDGRIVQGLVVAETPQSVTLQTLTDPVVVRATEIDQRYVSPMSMMPDGLLDPLSADDVQDLIAYLASPTQVALKGPRLDLDQSLPAGGLAWEAETLKVIGEVAGQVQRQDMRSFAADRWSEGHQLWWTGARPGDSMVLQLPVDQAGTYDLQLVLTRARDYAAVRLFLDDKPLDDGRVLDLFHSPQVLTTGLLEFPGQRLEVGTHRLAIEIVGKHPQAIAAFMVGVDVIRLVPSKGGE